MQLNELKRKNPNKKARQVGRGGTRGKQSGRGGKGQTARAGKKRRLQIRDIIKKLPKLRGYRLKSINVSNPVILKKSYVTSTKVKVESFSSIRNSLNLNFNKILIK